MENNFSSERNLTVHYIRIAQSVNVMILRLVILAFVVLIALALLGFFYDLFLTLIRQEVADVASTEYFKLLLGFGSYAIIALWVIHRWRSTFYEIYHDRIVLYGSYGRRLSETIFANDIAGVDYFQGMAGGVLNYGFIKIKLKTDLRGEVVLNNVPDPEYNKRNIQNIIVRQKEAI